MNLGIKYQGRIATTRDVEFVKNLIAENPGYSRTALSIKLCKAWDWVQRNGALQDIICRGFLLHLERAGYIELPPRRFIPNNPLAQRKSPPKVDIDQNPIDTTLSEILPLEIREVRRTAFEKTFNSLISEYHYLGYCHPVGEHLKYIVFKNHRPIACIAWSSAPRHIGCRDRFIGWSAETRKRNLHLIAYQGRYLILPWVKVKFLASHLLSRMANMLQKDWERIYSHPIYFIETFIDIERFWGTAYRAANWIYLGKTTGRGKNDQTNKVNRSIKAVFGYPLSKNFRRQLCREI